MISVFRLEEGHGHNGCRRESRPGPHGCRLRTADPRLQDRYSRQNAPMPESARAHDIVLFGVTGFVGGLLAIHLAQQVSPGMRIALAGRSRARVEAVRAGLPEAARRWE